MGTVRAAALLVVGCTLPLLLAAAAPADGSSSRLADLLGRSDALYARRDAPGVVDELRRTLDQAERLAPDDYGVLWRRSRLDLWVADDPSLSKKDKSRAGKQAWDYGDRATQADPGRAEGWDYAAAGMGNYALGIGVFQAMHEGIEGKLKERLSRAEHIDPDLDHGAIQIAWGRYWYSLPWPKYDARKSERALRGVLDRFPDNVRAHVYLADLYAKEGHRSRARGELRAALERPPGQYDAPEERRMQAVARTELDHLE